MGEEERQQAVDRWFRIYSGRVLSYLLHRTDPQTPQDLVQDVFVLAFGYRSSIGNRNGSVSGGVVARPGCQSVHLSKVTVTPSGLRPTA